MEKHVKRHLFRMQLSCTYKEDDNQIDSLDVKHLVEEEWQEFDLDTVTPGFLVFTYAIFTCQHMFMRINAAERGVVLASSTGSILVDAEPEWHIERLHVGFEARLKSGSATQEDIAYITGRMQQCPVSKNLVPIADAVADLAIV